MSFGKVMKPRPSFLEWLAIRWLRDNEAVALH